MGNDINEGVVQLPVVHEVYDKEYEWWLRYMEVCNMSMPSGKVLSEAEMREIVNRLLGIESGVGRARQAQVWSSLRSKGWSDKKMSDMGEMRKMLRRGMKVVIPYMLEIAY
jgi:hypothetical protein